MITISKKELEEFVKNIQHELFHHSKQELGKPQKSLIEMVQAIHNYELVVSNFGHYLPFIYDILIEMNISDNQVIVWNEILHLMSNKPEIRDIENSAAIEDTDETTDDFLDFAVEGTKEEDVSSGISEVSGNIRIGITIAQLFAESLGFFFKPIRNSKYFKKFNRFCEETKRIIQNKYFYISQLLGINLILDSIERKKSQSKNWRIFINTSIALLCLIGIAILIINSIPPTLNPFKFIAKNLQNIYK